MTETHLRRKPRFHLRERIRERRRESEKRERAKEEIRICVASLVSAGQRERERGEKED